MKFLKKWCGKYWLYVMYTIGVVLLLLLWINWDRLGILGQCMYAMAVILPLHVLEEWQLPGGFYWQYNLLWGSHTPERYPMCQLTDMITNLGGEMLYLILIAFFCENESVAFSNLCFCFLECLIHSILGVLSLKRYQNNGKRSIYGPGSVTAYFGFGTVGIILLFNIRWATMTAPIIIKGIALLLGQLALIFLPEGLLKRENNDFAFENAGYFEKFIK